MPDKNPTSWDDVRKRLRAEVNTGEHPRGSNNTKYGEWYGYNGVPWCAIFQCWVEAKAGGLLMPKTAYTPTMAQYFIDNKRFGKVPRVGALVFFNFPDSLDRIQHVGRVIDVINPTTVRSVEGNTSPGDSGSQDNGDGVYIRTRTHAGGIVGYGYPKYERDVPEFVFPTQRTFMRKGDKGADVKRWQIDLNRWVTALFGKKDPEDRKFWFHIDTDGKFDEETVKATKTFQAFYKLDVDGNVGKGTIGKMEAVRDRQRDNN